jgi:mannose-6-phosphate isomerase-like protein (cupin superfamily)
MSSTTPISTETATHYTWGDGCDGWHLVRAEGLSVIEERMPPATAEARHRHRRARQFFRVLSGVLRIEVEGRDVRVPAGHGLEIAPGDAHQVFNDGPEDAEFLVVSQPPSHGDREPA